MYLNLGNGDLRKALVVFQFVISIGLISSVIIITQQVKYSQKLDMGFSKENLIAMRLGTETVSRRFKAIRKVLNPSVVSVMLRDPIIIPLSLLWEIWV